MLTKFCRDKKTALRIQPMLKKALKFRRPFFQLRLSCSLRGGRGFCRGLRRSFSGSAGRKLSHLLSLPCDLRCGFWLHFALLCST